MATKAKTLKPGGTIGVPAPSSPYFNISELERAQEWWEGKGYKVKLGKGIHARTMYTAGDPKTRADDITAMFGDDEVDVVMTLHGGYGAQQAVPLIDWDVVKANPKPFIGYSDVTALHVPMYMKADLVTFYGPTFADSTHPKSKPFTRERLVKALTSTEPLGEVPLNPDDEFVSRIAPGKVTGEMVGGCLWLLGQAMGTPWQLNLDGKILFFEDVDCPIWFIDGILNQLTQAGALDNVIGVVVGELEKCDWSEGRPEWPQTLSLEDVLHQYIDPLGVPSLYGFPMGHGDYLTTTPLGVQVTLDADNKKLTIDEAALVD